ncbi:hypothetical protein E4U41_005857 [Claviceps citrina]|nr:hypothetical protein E4U41_005857 [Claviceps citrina]
MVPPPAALEAALIEGTCQVFNSDPDATTVNKVRKHVEEERGLDDGFFTSDEWKQRSKALIKEYVEKLLDGWEPKPKQDSDSNNGTKRQASEDQSSPPKRQKQGNKKGKDGAKPNRRGDNTTKTKTASRHKSQIAQPDQEPGMTIKDSPSESSEDFALSSIKVDTSRTQVKDESEEYSDVIDEAPKPKRRKREPKQKSSSKPSKPSKPSKSSKPPAARKSTTTTTDDPQEAEIKKLQSQLVKCGVRKLWHNELRQYGDDSRAKIRHLKKMLADIGMDGRFSETKAREIKETRELLAEAAAAQEMNARWGRDSGRRASRSKQKSMELADSDGSDHDMGTVGNGGNGHGGNDGNRDDNDDDDDDDDDGDEETTSFAARRRRAQADLAFLGDESESD